MTRRSFSPVIVCAAVSICGVIRAAGCAGGAALCEPVPASRSQATMPITAASTHEVRLIDHMQTQPFGDERRLVLTFDLDRDVDAHDDVTGLALRNLTERADGTNALSDSHGRGEPHLVEP